MEIGKSVIPLQKFEKLGLIRFALRPLSRLSKMKPPEDVTTAASAESFHEAKAFRAALEARRAEAFGHAHRILSAPR